MKRGVTKTFAIISVIGFSTLLFFAAHGFALAQGTGIWANTSCATRSTTGGPVGPCDFCDAIIVTNNIIQMLFKFSLGIGALMIVIGGVAMIVSAGSKEKFEKGKKILVKAVTGVAIALLSWIIVSTVIRVLTGSSAFPWNQISCTHNPQLQPLNSLPNLATASSTYMKVASNGSYACSVSGNSCNNSDFSGSFCSTATCYAGDKTECGQPAVGTTTVWAPANSATTYGSATIYDCSAGYTSQSACESGSGTSCTPITTNGVNPQDSQPQQTAASQYIIHAAIGNDGTFHCGTSTIQNVPAYAQIYELGQMPFLTDKWTNLGGLEDNCKSAIYNGMMQDNWCGANVAENLNEVNSCTPLGVNIGTDWTYFKWALNGGALCSPSGKSCNDIVGADPNDPCLVGRKSIIGPICGGGTTYAKISNNGVWACGYPASQIQGAPINATTYTVGQGYFINTSLCGKKVLPNYPTTPPNAVYAKKLSDGKYTCSFIDCNMPNSDPNADCTILPGLEQCEGQVLH
jgi:hypothetical protein